MRPALGVLVIALGCSSSTHLGEKAVIRQPMAEASPPEAFGRQVELTTRDTDAHGELLGCDETFVFVLLNQSEPGPSPYLVVRWDLVLRMEVSDDYGRLAVGIWTAVGTTSAISHGFYALITAPVWGLAGLSTLGAGPPDIGKRCAIAAPYARFPQGLPPAMRVRFGLDPPPPCPPPGGPPPNGPCLFPPYAPPPPPDAGVEDAAAPPASTDAAPDD